MRISKSGKLTVSLTCESASPGSRCFQKNLDSAVNPARRPMFDSSLSHSFLLPQRNCASVGTARALGGYNKKSPTENLAAANAHVLAGCAARGVRFNARCASIASSRINTTAHLPSESRLEFDPLL